MDTVSTLCSPFRCRKECLNYVRELRKNPCYDGEVGDFLRAMYLQDDDADISQQVHWYAKLDSCDKVLQEEGYVVDDDDTKGLTCGAPNLLSVTSTVLAVVCVLIYLLN